MTASDIGLVWGARHFLVLLVPLVWLSFQGFRLWAGKKRGFLLTIAALVPSVIIQSYGLFALDRVSRDSYTIEQALLASKPQVVVTDVFYLPEQMPRLFFEKTVVQVVTLQDVKILDEYIKKHNIKNFTLLLSPRFRQMKNSVLKELLTKFPLQAPPRHLTGQGGFPELFAGECCRH